MRLSLKSLYNLGWPAWWVFLLLALFLMEKVWPYHRFSLTTVGDIQNLVTRSFVFNNSAQKSSFLYVVLCKLSMNISHYYKKNRYRVMMSLLILLFYVTNQSLLLLIQIFMFANRLKLTDTNSTRKCTFKKKNYPRSKNHHRCEVWLCLRRYPLSFRPHPCYSRIID